MDNIKIAFFDIDGTLIDMNKKIISERMIETLIKLKEKNIIICVATGRPLKSIPHFESVEFDAFLSFNGSYCCNHKDVILKKPIPFEAVQKIIQNTSQLGRPVSLASVEQMGANGRDQDLIDYFAISEQAVEISNHFEEFAKDEIYQIMVGCGSDEYEQILRDVTGAEITAWWDRAADIIPANGGKGEGVRKILEYYGLSKEEAIAFGDGGNDIKMLQAVGTAVAMGNATENVKEIADEVCDTVSNDGIYYYCKKHHLI